MQMNANMRRTLVGRNQLLAASGLRISAGALCGHASVRMSTCRLN